MADDKKIRRSAVEEGAGAADWFRDTVARGADVWSKALNPTYRGTPPATAPTTISEGAPIFSHPGMVQSRAFVSSLFGGDPVADAAKTAAAVKLAAATSAAKQEVVSIAPKQAADARRAAPQGPTTPMFKNLTMNEALAMGEVLARFPGQAQVKPKDTAMAQTMQLSQAIFANDIKNAIELAKSDPGAGQKLTAKAMESRFQREAGLQGFNPMNYVQAQQMGGAGDQE